MNFIENLLAKSIKIELNEKETIVHQGGANLFRSNDVSGGILYLTNERLIFIPHKININKSRQDIEIDDIVSLTKVRTLIIRTSGVFNAYSLNNNSLTMKPNWGESGITTTS